MTHDTNPNDGSDDDGIDIIAEKKRLARRRRVIQTGQNPDLNGVDDGPHVPPVTHLDYRTASDLLYTWLEVYVQQDRSDAWLVERVTDLSLALDDRARRATRE